MVQKRLLIVEDDLNLTLALYSSLSHTYKVDTAKTAVSGLKKAETLPLDLIILDLNLPDANGAKLLQRLRETGVNTPVLVLSGDSSLNSKVGLLDSGANDYVTKPFSMAELRARIRVLLRLSAYPAKSILVSGDLELNPKTRQAVRSGITIDLRRKEYAILECLFRNAPTAVSRTYLSEYVWGKGSKPTTNTIDVHIKSLRDKIDNGFDSSLVRTVHGLGYALAIDKPAVRAD